MSLSEKLEWQRRKHRSHERIVDAAGRRMRRHGLGGFSVAQVMADAGLTHGGFYAHFRNKQALAAACVSDIADRAREMWFERLDGVRGGDCLKWLAGRYLRPRHRDHPEDGCLFAALAADVARGDGALRSAFDDALETSVDAVAARLDTLPTADARARAIGFIALCAGAVNLSRAVEREDFSNEILRAARKLAGTLADTDSDHQRDQTNEI